MGRKETEYMRGREDGLDLALRIVREGGLKALEDEIRFRGITGIHTSLAQKDFDRAAEQIKIMAVNTLKIAVIAVLHDEFGFGEKRVQRCMSGIDKFSEYLDKGWLCWLDVINDIKDRLNLDIEFMEGDGTIDEQYSRPDPADIWDESDFISDRDWKGILKKIGFKEEPSSNEKYCMVVVDENRDIQFGYSNRYEKLELYNFLLGVDYMMEQYGSGRKGDKTCSYTLQNASA